MAIETAEETKERPIMIKGKEGDDSEFAGMDRQEALIKTMTDKFERWAAWRKPYESLWSDIYSAYFSVMRKMKIVSRSRVVVPVAFQVMEAALPKLVNIVLGQTPFFEVVPEDLNDKPQADVIQRTLLYQLGQADFFLKFVDFTKQLLMYGTSYFLVYWKVRREWVHEKTPKRSDVTLFGITVKKSALEWTKKLEYKVVERRPELDVLDIADVYPDPDARTEKDASGVFIASSISVDELMEMGKGKFPVYENTDKLKEAQDSKDAFQVKQDRRLIRGTGDPNTKGTSETMVELITYWGKYDLDGDGIREEVEIVIANRKVLLRAKRNPFEHQQRPLVRTTLFPVPLEWFGIGLLEPILPLISELNTIRNQAIDVNNLIINRMWKVNSLADIDLDTLVSAPNAIILTNDMEGVTPIEQGSLPGSVYTDSQIIQSDIENTTAPKSVQGTPQSGQLGRTARGAQLIIGQALEKFGLAAKFSEESAIKRVLRMFHQLNLQFLDTDEVFTDTGLYGGVYDELVTPEMLRAQVRFKMMGLSETITKEAKINQIISFISIFKDIPGINLIEVAKMVWGLMDTNESADRVIQPAPFPDTLIQGGQASPVESAVANQTMTNGTTQGIQVPGVPPPAGGVGGII